MAARWAAVTWAQRLTLGTRSTNELRTCGVRAQMPASVTFAVAVSVAGTLPSPSVPRPVTVRVKVSSAPSASAGIFTSVEALMASLNVTVTPLAGWVSAQP